MHVGIFCLFNKRFLVYKYDQHPSEDVHIRSFSWASFYSLCWLVQIIHPSVSSSLVQVKAVYLHPEQFTIENGLLTPTLKAKRAELKTLFQPQINQLYANMS